MGTEEERRKRKRAKEERRKGKRHAEARNRLLRRVAIIGVVVAVIAGGSYFAITASLAGPGLGPLNSTHDHADIIAFINGERIDFSQEEYQVRSSYVHFEGGDGDVVHMHATNVNLGFTFQTLGMRITSTSITNQDGQLFENSAGRELKVYVNGVRIEDPANYVIQVLDKILIAYGDETEEEIEALLELIPDSAGEVQGAFPNPP